MCDFIIFSTRDLLAVEHKHNFTISFTKCSTFVSLQALCTKAPFWFKLRKTGFQPNAVPRRHCTPFCMPLTHYYRDQRLHPCPWLIPLSKLVIEVSGWYVSSWRTNIGSCGSDWKAFSKSDQNTSKNQIKKTSPTRINYLSTEYEVHTENFIFSWMNWPNEVNKELII